MDTPTTIPSLISPALCDHKAQSDAAVRRRGQLLAAMVAAPLALLLFLLAPAARAGDCLTVVVTNTADAGAGSLRQALADVSSLVAMARTATFSVFGPPPRRTRQAMA